MQKLVSLIWSPFWFLLIFLLLWETDLRKHWYDLCQRRFCLCSLLGVFVSSLVFVFKSLLVVFVYGVKVCSHFIDSHVAVQLFQHHLLKRLSFSHCIFLPPLWKINCPLVCGFISGLSILFHWSICLFLCQYHCILVTVACSIVWSLGGLFLLLCLFSPKDCFGN